MFSVPASKSVFNRAAVLACLSNTDVLLQCGELCRDSQIFLQCLRRMGVLLRPEKDGILVRGCDGMLPNREASLNVGDSGTAARFLSSLAAFCGGVYRFDASPQMKKRPMQHLSLLQQCGISISYEEEAEHLPFCMRSDGIRTHHMSIPTNISTQYASGLLLAACSLKCGFTLELTGERTQGSYIAMTLQMLRSFGYQIRREANSLQLKRQEHAPAVYAVEADVSSACYLFALAFLLRLKITVRHILRDSLQGDVRFFDLLAARGMRFEETKQGLCGDARDVSGFEGFCEDISDFSDQALTVAALAPFAASPTRLRGLSHIRHQECDRIRAIYENLSALGIRVEEYEDGVAIYPAHLPLPAARLKTYGDHRVAMAFSLIGAMQKGIGLDDPFCCQKTFPRYFQTLQAIVAMSNK